MLTTGPGGGGREAKGTVRAETLRPKEVAHYSTEGAGQGREEGGVWVGRGPR